MYNAHKSVLAYETVVLKRSSRKLIGYPLKWSNPQSALTTPDP